MMKSENNIPKFDLSEQILAGQRKFASIKRVAPTKNRISNRDRNRNNNTENKNISKITPNPIPDTKTNILSEQIISEIVARDIRKLRAKPLVR